MAAPKPFVPKRELLTEPPRENEKKRLYSESKPGTKGDKKFYAIVRGKSNGVYIGWDRAEPLVTGYSPQKKKLPCYKAFDREQDAWDWLSETKEKLKRKYKKNRRVTKTRPIPGNKKGEEEEYETDEEYISFEESSEDEVAKGPRRPPPPAPKKKATDVDTSWAGSQAFKSDRVWLVEEEPEAEAPKEAEVNFAGTPVAAAYLIGPIAGRGAFSIVKKGKNKQSNQEFALKVLAPEVNPEFNKANALKEVEITKTFGTHPNLLTFKESFALPNSVVIVLELAQGGDLLTFLAAGTTPYSEENARVYISQLVEAVDALHSKNIIHRDIVPENLLLAAKSDSAPLKLAGYSMASTCQDQIAFDGLVGTVTLQPPEVVTRQFAGKASDMWSVGVIAFVLLTGTFPFQDRNQMRLTMKIRKGEYDITNVPGNAKDFIKNLINPDAKARFSSSQAKGHAWLKGPGNKTPLSSFRATLKESVTQEVWIV